VGLGRALAVLNAFVGVPVYSHELVGELARILPTGQLPLSTQGRIATCFARIAAARGQAALHPHRTVLYDWCARSLEDAVTAVDASSAASEAHSPPKCEVETRALSRSCRSAFSLWLLLCAEEPQQQEMAVVGEGARASNAASVQRQRGQRLERLERLRVTGCTRWLWLLTRVYAQTRASVPNTEQLVQRAVWRWLPKGMTRALGVLDRALSEARVQLEARPLLEVFRAHASALGLAATGASATASELAWLVTRAAYLLLCVCARHCPQRLLYASRSALAEARREQQHNAEQLRRQLATAAHDDDDDKEEEEEVEEEEEEEGRADTHVHAHANEQEQEQEQRRLDELAAQIGCGVEVAVARSPRPALLAALHLVSALEPARASAAAVAASLLPWDLMLRLSAHTDTCTDVENWVRSTDALLPLLRALFDEEAVANPTLAHGALSLPPLIATQVAELASPAGWEQATQLSVRVYYECLRRLPAQTRQWWRSLKRGPSRSLEEYTQRHLSPHLVHRQLVAAIEWRAGEQQPAAQEHPPQNAFELGELGALQWLRALPRAPAAPADQREGVPVSAALADVQVLEDEEDLALENMARGDHGAELLDPARGCGAVPTAARRRERGLLPTAAALAAVAAAEEAKQKEGFRLVVRPGAQEIEARLREDGTELSVLVRLEGSYPLRACEVRWGSSADAGAINKSRWRRWQLQMTRVLQIRNGGVLQALLLWKQQLERHLSDVELCIICYSVFHGTDRSLPTLECRNCHNAFHGACLFRWFNTSHKSNCPLCQLPFQAVKKKI
jgi:Skp family chaperone for outer membrane proteins